MATDMPPPPAPGKNAPPAPGKNAPAAPGTDMQARFRGGPRLLAELLPRVTRPAFRKQGAATAQLLADWPAIVGPGLAAQTTPRRFAAGTLTLGCVGPVALELQHLSGPLMERINTHLGQRLVQRLRFVQEARMLAAAPVARAAPRAPVVVDGLPDGPLREALAALGAVVPSKRA